MSKQTRKEKKLQERRVIAEFEEALKEERASAPEKEEAQGKTSFYASADPERVHCRRCKTLMEKGVCPVCGYKIYQPMSEEKRRKTRAVFTAVALVILAVIFAWGLLRG